MSKRGPDGRWAPDFEQPLTNAERIRRQRSWRRKKEARWLANLVKIAETTTDETSRLLALEAIMEDGK